MSRHNYMRKRNRQLYCSSMESQTILFDSRRSTMVRQDALWWTWMSQAKMRASTSLRQFWLTHADTLHFQSVFAPIWLPKRSINGRTWQAANILMVFCTETFQVKQDTWCVHQQVSDRSGWLMLMHFIWTLKKTCYQGSQCASKCELGCAMFEIPAPLRALLFHHPQCIQNLQIMRFYQKLAAKHRMTATHWWQHAAGLQNLQRQAPQPPKEALEMLTVMFARTVQGGAGSSLASMETQY